MRKLQCLTVDDENGAHMVLKNYIDRIDALAHAGQCYNTTEAINFLHKNKVDILFLDINMPEMTGLEMLKTMTNKPKVILTTAHSEFALESYDYGVHDYLIKPIPFSRFLIAINRILAEKVESPQIPEATLQTNTFLFIQTSQDRVRIDFDQIYYIQSWGNYVKIHTGNQVYLANNTSKEIEDQLPKNQFFRIHRSYLVAKNNIDKIVGNQVYIKKVILPIGASFRRLFIENFNK